MQKQMVANDRYIELLNEEIQRHPFYRKGMQFKPGPAGHRAPKLLDITWDKEKWGEFDFVFAAAHRVVRARFETR
jgi:hypothetical protein